jgi:hypothetical protein
VEETAPNHRCHAEVIEDIKKQPVRYMPAQAVDQMFSNNCGLSISGGNFPA